jgi:hypothetical protein
MVLLGFTWLLGGLTLADGAVLHTAGLLAGDVAVRGLRPPAARRVAARRGTFVRAVIPCRG